MKLIIVVFFIVSASAIVSADELSDARRAVEQSDYSAALKHIRGAVAKKPQDPVTLELAARIYLELDILDTALSYSKRVYDDDNDEKSRVLLYAEALTRVNRHADASVILRKQLRIQDDIDLSVALVNALVEADSLRAAELTATTIRSKYPKNPSSYIALGNLYFNSKPIPVFELAVQNYVEALSLDSTLVKPHFNLAICYWRMGNRESDDELANSYFTRSLKEWDIVSKMDPKNARAWFEQGKILYLAGRFQQAVTALSKYRELRPLGTGEIMASWYLGESLYKLNLCDSAVVHLEDAGNRVDSLKPKVGLFMARCNFFSKKFSEAAKAFKSADAIADQWLDTDVWFYGVSLLVSGDTSNAIAVMAQAAKRDPKQCVLMFRYGILLQSLAKNASSTGIFQQRLANCPDSLDPKIHVYIGNNFFADSLIDSAIASYERSLALLPGYLYANLRLGETYLLADNQAKGKAILELVVTTAKASVSPDERRYGLSAMARLNGQDISDKKWQEIVERSKVGTELDSRSWLAWLYLAIGYQGLQDVENSKKAYREVLKIDPSNDTAKKNLKALGG